MHHLTRKRAHDYCLLILSLALILTGYGLVTGCFPTDIQAGIVFPESIDGDPFAARTADGAMKIPDTRQCVRAGLIESVCDLSKPGCSKIKWRIEKTGALPAQNVTLLTSTSVEICRPGDPSIEKTTVKLLGEYNIPGLITPVGTPIPIPQTTIAYIPVRFE